MALTILVRSGDGKSVPRITFDTPRVVIGRGDGCEIRLPDPSVSHRHASIRQRGTEYIVMDEGSTNGTFVGPVRLSPQAPRMLKSGDLVRVGRVWLEVCIEQAVPTPNGPQATREIALGLIAEALAADGTAAALTVRVTEGPGEGASLVIDEPDRVYVVGRMPTADLNIDDADLSRRHVELVKRASRMFVRDLGSKNGSMLGTKRLPAKQETPWSKDEPLVIGKARLTYEDPLSLALEQLESAADEKNRRKRADFSAHPLGQESEQSPPEWRPRISRARPAGVWLRSARVPSETTPRTRAVGR